MRIPALLLGALAVVATTTAATATDSNADEAKLAAQGRAIAQERCGRCHGIGSDDASPHEKAPPFRFVAERYPSEHLAEALAEGIVTGHEAMPVFVFEPPAIEAFLAYLNSLPPGAAGQSKSRGK